MMIMEAEGVSRHQVPNSPTHNEICVCFWFLGWLYHELWKTPYTVTTMRRSRLCSSCWPWIYREYRSFWGSPEPWVALSVKQTLCSGSGPPAMPSLRWATLVWTWYTQGWSRELSLPHTQHGSSLTYFLFQMDTCNQTSLLPLRSSGKGSCLHSFPLRPPSVIGWVKCTESVS